MKTLVGSLLLFTSLFWPSAARPGALVDVRLDITNVSPSGTLSVRLTNNSKNIIRIWEDDNSWGAARWRVLLVRRGQLETFFENPNRIFTMNIPTFKEIASGNYTEQKLDLNGGNWCGLTYCASYNERGFGDKRATFQHGDTVVVLYDVPTSIEAGKMKVWYGVVAASAIVE